jgi:beta,beta-carotene 9',10'-dioxygenase
MPIRFDPVTLNTLGRYDYDERIKGPVSIAHPRLDHASDRHYTYSLEFGRRSKYHLIGIDQAAGQEAVVATLRAERPAYIHSFGMSEWYFVLAEFPLVVNPLRLKFSGKPFIRNYQWEPDRGGPVSRRREGKRASGAEQRGAGRAVFAFHHVNASKRATRCGGHRGFPGFRRHQPGLPRSSAFGRAGNGDRKLTQLRIGSSEDVSDERLSETRIEFPRINTGAAPDAGTATFMGLGTRCGKTSSTIS